MNAEWSRLEEALILQGAAPARVPAEYAEKTMASLLKLHDELMEEKERQIALHQTLMHKEQQLAELGGYVRLLEERLHRAEEVLPENPPRVAEQTAPLKQDQPPSALVEPPSVPPREDGWRVW